MPPLLLARHLTIKAFGLQELRELRSPMTAPRAADC
jgi:hypothetical protein